MKRILKLILCILLVFSFVPKHEAQAEDPGIVTNITFDSAGRLTWDAYPGAAYYVIAFTGYKVGGTTTGTSYDQLPSDLQAIYSGPGTYGAQVAAYDRIGRYIATGVSKNTYNYPGSAYGKMAAPSGASWQNGYQAYFNTVPGAQIYAVTLYANGTWVNEIWVASPGTDLSYYCFGPKTDYTFTVSAMAYGHERSDPSAASPATTGATRILGRLSGKTRYDTAIDVANMFRIYEYGSPYVNFDNIVLTTGKNYPDALSGASLANRLKAPVLLINQKSSADVVNYINSTLAPNGTVYILGGEGVVENGWLAGLDENFRQIRLSGNNRYNTNLEILREYYKHEPGGGEDNGYTMLVCTGNNYADSLSCSALDYPILLVGDSLTAKQREFLASMPKEYLRFYLIGGTGAVSDEVAYELADYGLIYGRIAGKNRYETSQAIAEKFRFGANFVVVATGKDFPDGLAGGPLAYAFGAPLVLAAEGHTENAATVTNVPNFGVGYVLGGTGVISYQVFSDVFHVAG